MKDERIKNMNEILNGIKVLKLYAWEPSFQVGYWINPVGEVLPLLLPLLPLTLFVYLCSYRSRYTFSNWPKAALGTETRSKKPTNIGINPLIVEVQSYQTQRIQKGETRRKR